MGRLIRQRSKGDDTEFIVQGADHPPADNPRGPDDLFGLGGLLFMTQDGPGTDVSSNVVPTSFIPHRVLPDPTLIPEDGSAAIPWEYLRNSPSDVSVQG